MALGIPGRGVELGCHGRFEGRGSIRAARREVKAGEACCMTPITLLPTQGSKHRPSLTLPRTWARPSRAQGLQDQEARGTGTRAFGEMS